MIELTLENDIAHLHFDDGKANVLNSASLGALEEALEQAKEAKAVVFSGREGTFSGGLDLRTLPTLPAEQFRATLRQFTGLCRTLVTYPRPVVAAVTGHAIAGGTVLLLCCDHRVGEPGDFKLGLSEVPLGMPLPTFVLRLAEHSVSKRHIIEAALHGRLYPPTEAETVGYLQSVAEPGHTIARAHQVAANLGSLPNPAYQLTKARLTSALVESLSTFDEEMEYFVTSFDWSKGKR